MNEGDVVNKIWPWQHTSLKRNKQANNVVTLTDLIKRKIIPTKPALLTYKILPP